MAVIGNARGHEKTADIGKAQSKRAIFVRQLGNFLRRELRHQHRDFENDGPEADGMFVGFDIERSVSALELNEVQRGKVAGRIIEEHVFRAWIRRADFA